MTPSTSSSTSDPVAAPEPVIVPELALVLLIGVSGSGKSTFARRQFAETEVVSSDHCRALVSDDEHDQSATRAAFAVLHTIVERRLELGRFTVVDATNVQEWARRPLLAMARRFHVPAHAIVFDIPLETCVARNQRRQADAVPEAVLAEQGRHLRESLPRLRREGFTGAIHFATGDHAGRVEVRRDPLPDDHRHEHGPFDLIGDIHGCATELFTLLDELGYPVDADGRVGPHPQQRRVVFLGDLVDRGPAIVPVFRTAMQMVADGVALAVEGNHEDKLARALSGNDVSVTGGLARSLEQIDATPDAESLRQDVIDFIHGLPDHIRLDGGALVAVHAGLPASMQGRSSRAVRAFALYGDVTGALDANGNQIRRDWAASYDGEAFVVYGHTPTDAPEIRFGTICVDTGCVFGGSLTALRYPENTLVEVPAPGRYYPVPPQLPAPAAP